jgi:spore coat polysaccharide biosynthesis predicted glycosyltransferase SpsG
VRQILTAGGAVTSMAGLGLPRGHLRRSLVLARQIRSRFTILDFAAELGVLDGLADAVMTRSGC